MKPLLILFGCFLVAINCERTEEEQKIFREWVAKFEKKYKTPEAEAKAMENLLKIYHEITEHNKLYEQGKVYYLRALFKYSDLTPEERAKNLLGAADPKDRTKRAATSPPKVPEGPPSLNWAEKGLVSPVKDQSKLCYVEILTFKIVFLSILKTLVDLAGHLEQQELLKELLLNKIPVFRYRSLNRIF